MSFPKISSISTVGILKHFNQDYLIHPLRTDFTGGNGVGKSIIADLFQIIFICHEGNIKFGTESFNKDKREVQKLPYKGNEAYAFLNIEVAESKFITIGVNIQSKGGRHIKPFLVLAQSNFTLDINELSYDKEHLLTNRDFLDEQNKIMPLEQLSKQLKEKLNLFLSYYTYKEDIEKYHSFLFSKEILPINLTIPEHLKAFSKVIQSFSKVKDLGLDKPNSLKEFLFEDDDKEYWEEYSKHEQQLDKLLNEFKDLNIKIDDIEQKQRTLENLKNFEKLKDDAELIYKTAELKELSQKLLNQKENEKDISNKLSKNNDRSDFLQKRVKKFKKLVESLDLFYSDLDRNHTKLLEYNVKYQDWKKFDSEISQLKNIVSPLFSEDTVKNSISVDFKDTSTRDIVKKINVAAPIFSEYGQINDIEQKHQEQDKVLTSLINQTEGKLNHLEKINSLLNEKGSDSLFARIVNEKKALTHNQESVLLSLLDLSLKKPEKVAPRIRYVLSTAILNEDNYELDKVNGGLWLKLGELREFIEFSKEKRLFQKDSNFENLITNKLNELKDQIDKLELEKLELSKIRKSKEYDKEIIKEYEFDIRLIEYSNIEELKRTVWILENKEEKIALLENESSELKIEIDNIASEISLPIDNSNLPHQIKKAEAIKQIIDKRRKSIVDSKDKENAELAGIIVENPHLKENLEKLTNDISRISTDFEEKKELFQKRFPQFDFDIGTVESINGEKIEDLRSDFSTKKENYITEYKSTINRFEETSEGKDQQVNMQISQNLYQFKILEEVLLGGKIQYLDKVGDYLNEANQQRLRIVENIRDNMVKVFSKTLDRYEKYQNIVKNLNTFFIGKKISDTYYLNLNFNEYNQMKISWIEELQISAQWVTKPEELPFGHSVQSFIETLFKKITGIRKDIEFKDLLNPKSYFDLSIALTDEFKNEIPGSTGETYSAIILLGIARLSKVQEKHRKGLRFIILEELANLDNTNFNVFPKIAKEYDYQILTMTPRPYSSDVEDGWYLHHLIKGKEDININYPNPASYYKTKGKREDLKIYLSALKR